MRPSRRLSPVLLALLFAGCDETQNASAPDTADPNRLMVLQLDSARVGVGVRGPLGILAIMTRDAAGTSTTFSASDGSFVGGPPRRDTSATVDLNGRVRVLWYPPATTGNVRFIASNGAVRAETTVTVTPVPPVTLTGLTATATVNQRFTVSIQADARWANATIEVVAPLAQLQAAGPVADAVVSGTRIRPVLDANGAATILVQMPAAAATVTVTVALFGTLTTTTVTVN